LHTKVRHYAIVHQSGTKFIRPESAQPSCPGRFSPTETTPKQLVHVPWPTALCSRPHLPPAGTTFGLVTRRKNKRMVCCTIGRAGAFSCQVRLHRRAKSWRWAIGRTGQRRATFVLTPYTGNLHRTDVHPIPVPTSLCQCLRYGSVPI